MAEKQLSPAERLAYFSQLTRHNLQKLPAIALPESSTISFSLPKTRITNKILLLVKGTFKVAHASATTFTPKRFAPYDFLRNIRVEVNNGFNPFSLSGVGLYQYNITRILNDIFSPVASGRSMAQLTNTASVGGTTNTVKMLLELPFSINDRDNIGMILTQSEEVTVNINIDTNTVLSGILGNAAGFTVSEVNLAVYPLVESFTVPNLPQAMPDLSVIKLVNEKIETISQTGDFTTKMNIGTTYRKILLDLTDTNGVAMGEDDINSIQIIFNQADIPYNIEGHQLQALNQLQYGQALPQGVYALDFASLQGPLANYSGSRDLIDSERLSEFWIRVNVNKTGSARIISESLAQLRG